MRDSVTFRPLERHFGTLSVGNAFGESLLHYDKQFYNAIAFTDVITLSLDKKEYMKFLN